MPISAPWQSFKNGSAPSSEGVYELGNSTGSIVYIGRSMNLLNRLNEHASADGRTCIGGSAEYFRYELTTASITRERQLFREYKQMNGNDIPPCNTQDPS